MHFTDLVFATFPVSGFLSTSVSHSVSLVLLCLRLLLLAGRGLRQPKPKPVKPLSSSWCDGVATSKLLGNILVWPKALIVALLSPLSLALSTAPAADDCSKNGGVWPLAHFAAAFSGILWPLRRNWHLLRNLSPSPAFLRWQVARKMNSLLREVVGNRIYWGMQRPLSGFLTNHHIISITCEVYDKKWVEISTAYVTAVA